MAKGRNMPLDRNTILRFPSGIKDDEAGQKLIMHFKLCFQALGPVFIDVPDKPNRVRCKVDSVTAGIFRNVISQWISELIANPQANRPKQEIASDPNHYSMSICADSVVYNGMVPISNIEDSEGCFTFSYNGKSQI